MPPNLKRVLFLPDLHAPYHDKRAFDLFLKAGRAFNPDTLVTLGDTYDFYAVSSHQKDPRRTALLEDELAQAVGILEQLEALGAKQKIFVCGNHEYRLERYLMNKAPELFGVVSVPEVLELGPDWEYVPYRDHTRLGKLYITHDVGHAGKYALHQTQSAYEASVIFGHTHRLGYVVTGNIKGKPHVGLTAGHLSDLKKVDYMYKAKANRDWCHGFAYGYIEPNGNCHLVPVPIVDNKCVVEGRLVTG